MPTPLEIEDLRLARAGDRDAYSRLAEPHRRELLVHCYRMLGSVQDAEDQVQETLLRAWRRLETFQTNTSFRAWLYKIATNACLDALDQRVRRTLPKHSHPPADPRAMFDPPLAESLWVEPLLDERWADAAPSLEARYSAAASVTLAFLVALQVLPPRQRAVLILRDVLDFSAKEAADSLALSVAAANSALHRARTALGQHYQPDEPEPADAALSALLDQYVRAWQAADVGQLVRLLREDAVLTMPPTPSWYRGRAAIGLFMAALPFAGDGRGRWRLKPTRANSQPAFAFYRSDPAGAGYVPVGLQVLTLRGGQIAALDVFLQPAFFALLGTGAQAAAR